MSSETTILNYQALLNERKLCAAECPSCKTLMLPPRLFCTKCHKRGTRWKVLSGRGKIRSFTVIHIAATTHAADAPFVVVVVRLKEGPSITARLIGVNPLKPEDIKVGASVVADFEEASGPTSDQPDMRLVFRPYLVHK